MNETDSSGIYTEQEEAIIRSVSRSKVWRLIRDALCYERECLYNRRAATTEELWTREGELRQVQRLLRQGPHLVVLYDRYVREQAEQAERGESAPDTPAARTVGDPPDLTET